MSALGLGRAKTPERHDGVELVLTGEPFDHLARGSRHGGRWLIAAENPQTPRFMHFRYVTHVPRSILLCTRTLGDLRNHARK